MEYNGKQIIKIEQVVDKKIETTAAQYYLDVRNNKLPLCYLHPDLEPILKETNGVICYQEQLMKIIVDLGGHTLEESDVIRSAIAKKKRNIMLAAFDKIRASTKLRGWTENQTEQLCLQIEAFARYSFNLSHSHAYSELGYITMYLKHYHPLEWWTSVLNSHLADEDKLRKDISLLKHLVVSPSLLSCFDKFTISGDKIRAPISAIKGVGVRAIEELSQHKSINSLQEYMDKVNKKVVNVGVFFALIQSGAFDHTFPVCSSLEELNLNRKQLVQTYLLNMKIKKKIDDFVFHTNPIDAYINQLSINTVSNKSIIEDTFNQKWLISNFDFFFGSSHKEYPLLFGDSKGDKIVVAKDISILEKLIEKQYDGKIAILGLYKSSVFKTGISKKTGEKWSNTSIVLSDGYNDFDAVQWKTNHNLLLKENSLVLVAGRIYKGYQKTVNFNVHDLKVLKEQV